MEPDVCTKRCESCVFAGNLSGAPVCDFLLITGKMRGCPAGDKCDKHSTDVTARTLRGWDRDLRIPAKAQETSQPSPPNQPCRIKINKEMLILMKLAGKSDTECARLFGCTQPTVFACRKRLENEGRLPVRITSQKRRNNHEHK